MLSKLGAVTFLQREGKKKDLDLMRTPASAELVKIPLSFTRHLFRLRFTDSNLLMKPAAEVHVPCITAL